MFCVRHKDYQVKKKDKEREQEKGRKKEMGEEGRKIKQCN